jgi:hypothetical protein
MPDVTSIAATGILSSSFSASESSFIGSKGANEKKSTKRCRRKLR